MNWNWGLANAAMLAGLAGVLIPVILHWMRRRNDPVIDWGAMMFLREGASSRRWFHPSEWLLLVLRMVILAVVAFALCLPFLEPKPRLMPGSGEADGGRPSPKKAGGGGVGSGGGGGTRRDVVIVLDQSASMARRAGNEPSLQTRAIAWTQDFLGRLGAGDTAAVLLAHDRVQPWITPPARNPSSLVDRLQGIRPAWGSSDLAAALVEAFSLLETSSKNPQRDVIVVTDGQRFAWRPEEQARWKLVRDLHRRLDPAPSLWVLELAPPPPIDTPNGAVSRIELGRPRARVGEPIATTITVENQGPGSLTRSVDLLIDGEPAAGSSRLVGPIAAGGRASVTVSATITTPGRHVVSGRLEGDGLDPSPADDQASVPVLVGDPVNLLLVEGTPGRGPLRGSADFLRAALSPQGDDSPRVLTRLVGPEGLTSAALMDTQVAILANVNRLGIPQREALEAWLARGGGLAVIAGDQTEPDWAGEPGLAALPARIGEWRAGPLREVIAHPAPPTFAGPVMEAFRVGEPPAWASADLSGYRRLEVSAGAAVWARLDTSDPWIVARDRATPTATGSGSSPGQADEDPGGAGARAGRGLGGRVVMLASPPTADTGTVAVNPEFVPWAHELVAWLAGSTAPRLAQPGEPLVVELEGSAAPEPTTSEIPVRGPDGLALTAKITREPGIDEDSPRVRAVLDDPPLPGLYRFELPAAANRAMVIGVQSDPREARVEPLSPAEKETLAQGWPWSLAVEPASEVGEGGKALAAQILSGGGGRARRDLWRWLMVLGLLGLCAEVWMTRALVREAD